MNISQEWVIAHNKIRVIKSHSERGLGMKIYLNGSNRLSLRSYVWSGIPTEFSLTGGGLSWDNVVESGEWNGTRLSLRAARSARNRTCSLTRLTWPIMCDDTTKLLIIILVGAALTRPSNDTGAARQCTLCTTQPILAFSFSLSVRALAK